MKRVKDLADLLINELEELRCGELLLQKELPKLIQNTQNSKLNKLFNEYENIIKTRHVRLNKVFDTLEITPEIMDCKVMGSLIEVAKKKYSKNADHHIDDAALVLAFQCICHFKIANYGTLHAFAVALDKSDLITFFKKSLEEEKKTDENLSKLAIETINKKSKPKSKEESLI